MTKIRWFLMFRKISLFPQKLGFNINKNILTTNPYQVVACFQFIDKKKNSTNLKSLTQLCPKQWLVKVYQSYNFNRLPFQTELPGTNVQLTMVFLILCRLKKGSPQKRVKIKTFKLLLSVRLLCPTQQPVKVRRLVIFN